MSTFKRSFLFCFGAFLMLIHEVSLAQKRQKTIENFVGSWEGTGTLFGNDANFSMEWEFTMNNAFLQLKYTNRLSNNTTPNSQFKAIGLYKSIDNRSYEGSWFDSRGVQHQLKATFEDGALTTIWSNESGAKGKTIYRLLNKKSFEVKDYVWKADQWSEFATANYFKK